MYKHILIPTDGSPLADKAVDAGIEYASEAGARVTFFTAMPEFRLPSEAQLYAPQRVVSLPEHEERSRHSANARLAAAVVKASTLQVDCATDYVLSDDPAQAIVEAARRNGCDAIFMASHGRKGLAALLHPSETIAVLTHSDIPTVVYR